MDGSFGALLAISVVGIVTPGQDTALTVAPSRQAGVVTAIGVAAGHGPVGDRTLMLTS